jgi:hypothetical protein
MGTAKAILAVIGVFILVAALSFAGYQFHWFIAKSSANHQSQINRTGYNFQTTLRTEMYQNIGTVRDIDVQIAQSPDNAGPLQAQRKATIDTICNEAAQLQGQAPTNIASFVSQECPA